MEPEVAKKRSRAPLIIILLLLAIVAGAAGWGRQWVLDSLKAVQPGDTVPVLVEIPSGASTREVADLLHGRHLVKDANVFRYYVRYKKLDSQIKSGEYELAAGMTPDEILDKLIRGEVVVRRFTIPEGLTIEQMADVLAEKQLVNGESFLKLAAMADAVKEIIPADRALEYPLEGYLFPSTYEYKPGVTEAEIIGMMLERFHQVWTPEFAARAEELGLSVHEVMTLASIVEKEAQAAKERPVISGVYHNRLNIGMKLDADPTIRYALKKLPTEDLHAEDLQVESPYNTYTTNGLPPGPIAAPGEDSIRAALWPETHDYWFFVAKADGSGEHYFATTLDEQIENIEKARQNAGGN